MRVAPADRLVAGLILEETERVPGLGPCWTWSGRFNHGTGYGEILSRESDRRRVIATHRLAYEVASGQPIPDGLSILHTCDIRLCCRNDDQGIYPVDGVDHPRFGHLWIGTQADNLADMAQKGRGAIGDRNGTRTHPERRTRGVQWYERIATTIQKGSEHGNAKLTEEAVQEIRRIYNDGVTNQRELASMFGIGQTAVSAIIRRRLWKHIP